MKELQEQQDPPLTDVEVAEYYSIKEELAWHINSPQNRVISLNGKRANELMRSRNSPDPTRTARSAAVRV